MEAVRAGMKRREGERESSLSGNKKHIIQVGWVCCEGRSLSSIGEVVHQSENSGPAKRHQQCLDERLLRNWRKRALVAGFGLLDQKFQSRDAFPLRVGQGFEQPFF